MRTGLQARPKPGSAKARRRLSDVLNAQTSSTLVHPRPLSPPPRSDFFHPPFLFSGVSHCSCSPYSSKDSTPLDRPADGAHGAPVYSKPRPSCRTQHNGRGSCPCGENRRRHPLRRRMSAGRGYLPGSLRQSKPKSGNVYRVIDGPVPTRQSSLHFPIRCYAVRLLHAPKFRRVFNDF